MSHRKMPSSSRFQQVALEIGLVFKRGDAKKVRMFVHENV